MRRRGTRCDQTGMCQEWEPGEQEEVVERDQPEVGTVEQVGPGFLGLAGSCRVQRDFLGDDDLLVDHHPVVVRRVAHLGRVLPRSVFELGSEGPWFPSFVPMQDL